MQTLQLKGFDGGKVNISSPWHSSDHAHCLKKYKAHISSTSEGVSESLLQHTDVVSFKIAWSSIPGHFSHYIPHLTTEDLEVSQSAITSLKVPRYSTPHADIDQMRRRDRCHGVVGRRGQVCSRGGAEWLRARRYRVSLSLPSPPSPPPSTSLRPSK